MHRLFVAIRPPEAVRDALLDTMEGVDGARWQEDDQLHLTLRYIGEADQHTANDLAEALGTVSFAPFPIAVRGTGTFERKGRVHTLFADIERTPPLVALRGRVERICIETGLEPEHRKFAPHITLARLNSSSGPVAPYLAAHAGLRLDPWECTSFFLYESHLRPTGSIYEPVVTYPASTRSGA